MLDVYTHVTAGMKKKLRKKAAASWRVLANSKNEQKRARRLPEILRRRHFASSGAFRSKFPLWKYYELIL